MYDKARFDRRRLSPPAGGRKQALPSSTTFKKTQDSQALVPRSLDIYSKRIACTTIFSGSDFFFHFIPGFSHCNVRRIWTPTTSSRSFALKTYLTRSRERLPISSPRHATREPFKPVTLTTPFSIVLPLKSMSAVTHNNYQDRSPTSSPPSSPQHFSSSREGSAMSSPVVITPQPLPPFTASPPEKESTHNDYHRPMASPGYGVEFNITLASPQQDSVPSFYGQSITQSISLHRKGSAPVLHRHRSFHSSNGSTRSRNSATAAASSSTRTHPYHLQPYGERPQRRRDADGLIQKPPPILLRRHARGRSDENGSRSVSPGVPTPITIPSIPDFMRVPSMSGSPAPLAPVPLPSSPPPMQSKGPIQPSVTNVPRRRRKEPRYTDAELREQRQWDWERRVALCEVGTESGVFVSFHDDQDDDELMDDFVSFVRIVQSEKDAHLDGQVVIHDNRTIQLSIPWGPSRDDGLPHLTTTQLRAAVHFVQDIWSRTTRMASKRLLVITPNNRPTDAMAIAVTLLASQGQDYNTVSAPLLFAHDNDMDVDHPSPSAVQETPIHSILMQVHDLANEDDGHYLTTGGLKGPWRGVISRDGMDFLAGCL
ncbi:hypothetical protein DL96DRAFT_1555412 [Flagelloscypha sp. PMI_526]|nr:hypothetical protein DL96DRAFT_1555412 [Flagelloscypha sp. PMI_526]